MDRPVILVVDDERANAVMCQTVLQMEGYEVLTASGTKEAQDILSARNVDAIVCDVQMPHNGKRVYEYLLASHPELVGRFIFVTGNESKKQELERQGHKAPCLMKPFDIQALTAAMRTALA